MGNRDFQAPATLQKHVEDFIDGTRPESKVRKAWNMIQPLLVSGEQVEHLLIQGMTAMKLHAGAVAMTNRRVIFLQPGLMKMSFHDLLWRNMQEVHLVETLTGGELVLQDTQAVVVRMGHFHKEAARKAYAYAQQLEEAAMEFRRQRALEETRAAARGVAVSHVQADHQVFQAPASGAGGAAGASDPVAALSTLKNMLDQGLLDEKAYQAKRDEILARL